MKGQNANGVNQVVSKISFQKFTLELYSNPSTIHVSSPSNDKYLGLLALVLFHSKFKSSEFGFLK